MISTACSPRAPAKPACRHVISFGEGEGADIRLTSYESDGASAQIGAEVFGEPLSFSLGAPGRHQAMNALSVIAAARALGLPAVRVVRGLKSFGAGAGRGAQSAISLADGRRITLLDESYNANPPRWRSRLSCSAS
ncbi:MAG: hypothetical protein R3C40_09340 [Parvularculaceae bacterium]